MEEAGLKLVAQGADAFFRDMDRAGAAVDKFGGETEQAAGRAGGAFGRIGSLASSALGGVGTVLGGLATAAAGATLAVGAGLVTAVGGAAAAGLGFNNSVEQATARINAFTKDSAKTAAILEMVEDRAAKTPFAFSEMANAAAALGPSAKSAQIPLEELIGTAEILAASNPAEGLEGAAFAIKEALSGDFTSAIERFNLSRSYINQLREEGVPDLEALSLAMQQAGYDADLVSQLAETAQGRLSTFLDTFTSLAGTVTEPIFEAFSSGLGAVNAELEKNAPALEGIATRLSEQIAPYAEAAGKAVGEFAGNLIAVVGALADAGPGSLEFQEALSALPGPLAGAISGVVDFAAALGGNQEALDRLPGTVQTIVRVIQGMPEAFAGAQQAVQDFFNTPLGTAIKDAASGVADYLVNDFGPDVEGALASGRKALDDFFATPLGTEIQQGAGVVADYFANDFVPDLTNGVAVVQRAFDDLAASPWGQSVQRGARVVGAYFSNEWPQDFQNGVAIVSAKLEELGAFLSPWGERIKRGAKVVGDFMANDFPGDFRRGVDLIVEFFTALPGRAQEGLDALVSAVQKLPGTISGAAAEVGQAIIAGIAGGISNGVGTIISAAQSAAQAALDAAMGALGIKSPSQVFASEVGIPISQGIAEGVLAAAGAIEQAMAQLGDGMEEQGRELARRLSDSFKRGVDLVGALGGGADRIAALQEAHWKVEETFRKAQANAGQDIHAYVRAREALIASQERTSRAILAEQDAQRTGLQIGADDPTRGAAFVSQRARQVAEIAKIEERIAKAQAASNANGVLLLERQLGLAYERQALELRALGAGSAGSVQQLISGAAVQLLGMAGSSTSTTTNYWQYSPSYGGAPPSPSQDFAAMRLLSA